MTGQPTAGWGSLVTTSRCLETCGSRPAFAARGHRRHLYVRDRFVRLHQPDAALVTSKPLLLRALRDGVPPEPRVRSVFAAAGVVRRASVIPDLDRLSRLQQLCEQTREPDRELQLPLRRQRLPHRAAARVSSAITSASCPGTITSAFGKARPRRGRHSRSARRQQQPPPCRRTSPPPWGRDPPGGRARLPPRPPQPIARTAAAVNQRAPLQDNRPLRDQGQQSSRWLTDDDRRATSRPTLSIHPRKRQWRHTSAGRLAASRRSRCLLA